jgi:hypothetical protein
MPRPSIEDYYCTTKRHLTVHPKGTIGVLTPNNITTPLVVEIDLYNLIMQQLISLVKAVIN